MYIHTHTHIYIYIYIEVNSCFSCAYFCCTDGIFMMTSYNSGFQPGYMYKNVWNAIFCVVRVISNLRSAWHTVNPRSLWVVTGCDNGLLDKIVLRELLMGKIRLCAWGRLWNPHLSICCNFWTFDSYTQCLGIWCCPLRRRVNNHPRLYACI